MSDQENFLQWKIRNGMFGWDHEYAELIDAAHDLGVGSGLSELASLRQQLEAERARVAELEAELGSAWSSHCLEAVDWVDRAKEVLARSNSAPFLLRAQADAVDAAMEEPLALDLTPEAKWVSGPIFINQDRLRKHIEDHTQRLRQKADQIDEGGVR